MLLFSPVLSKNYRYPVFKVKEIGGHLVKSCDISEEKSQLATAAHSTTWVFSSLSMIIVIIYKNQPNCETQWKRGGSVKCEAKEIKVGYLLVQMPQFIQRPQYADLSVFWFGENFEYIVESGQKKRTNCTGNEGIFLTSNGFQFSFTPLLQTIIAANATRLHSWWFATTADTLHHYCGFKSAHNKLSLQFGIMTLTWRAQQMYDWWI